MTSKNSLKINRRLYTKMLENFLKHDCYINSFNSMRRQHENFLEESPTINDFTANIDTLKIGLPYPISEHVLLKQNLDCCKTLLQEKQIYNDKLNSCLHRYKKDRKTYTKKYSKNIKYGRLPKYMFDLSVGNIKDPDIYFKENYNWYYTGGILDTCTILNNKYLVYPTSDNLIYVKNTTEGSHALKMDILDETPIFSLKNCDDKNNVICLRQKHKVYALTLDMTNENFSTNVLTLKESEIPYVDVKFNNNELSTLNVNKQLKLHDLSKHGCDTYNFEEIDAKSLNSFGQFEYLNENEIIFLDRNSLRIFDKRSQEEKRFKIEDNFFKCDELCMFTLSNDEDYIFLSSTHNIFKFNLKQMNIVKTWSHMLSSPPLMMKMNKISNDEILFVSTQHYNERIVLLSNIDESNLVQIVPNNMETWEQCNKIYNFNLYNENVKRLKFSTAGIAITTDNQKGVDLYTSNSLGDVFQNNITQTSMSLTEPLKSLNRWINSLPKNPKPLTISHVRELSHVKGSLNEPIKISNLERYTKENEKRLDFLNEMTLETEDMAKIWLTEENSDPIDLAPSILANMKVSEWLQQDNNYISDDECVQNGSNDDNNHIYKNSQETYEQISPPKILIDEHTDESSFWYYLSKVPIVVPFVIYTKKK